MVFGAPDHLLLSRLLSNKTNPKSLSRLLGFLFAEYAPAYERDPVQHLVDYGGQCKYRHGKDE